MMTADTWAFGFSCFILGVACAMLASTLIRWGNR
jgi:hypothetical protein